MQLSEEMVTNAFALQCNGQDPLSFSGVLPQMKEKELYLVQDYTLQTNTCLKKYWIRLVKQWQWAKSLHVVTSSAIILTT